MSSAQTRTVTAEDGRTIEVTTSGPEQGVTLLYHHGTPMAAVPFPLLEREAHERGVWVVSYSRPGYGGSTPRVDGRVADDAADVAAVLDHLGVEQFVTLGVSGGGPRALACAALLPGRCLAASTVGGVAPFDAQGLDFLAGMGPDNVEEFGAAVAGMGPLEEWLARNAPPYFSATGDDVAAALGELLPDVDRRALTGELADYLAASTRHAGEQGVVGWRDDDLVLVRPWGFDVRAITVPVAVWQGAQDRMVPFAHGRWLTESIPGARAHLYDDEGHLSLVAQPGRIVDDLLRGAEE